MTPASPTATPAHLEDLLDRLAASDPALWTTPPDLDAIRHAAGTVGEGALRGWTFSVKDNIDVEGTPTTAAIPSRQDPASATATVVGRLLTAGALAVGKANLDQVATGLVGLRSPYGSPRNPHDPALVPGGSSSGSSVGVALGLVDLSLATDTAGSGRVPPACCGVVGLKPAPGVLPLDGVLPASPSFDCVSVVTRTVDESLAAGAVLGAGFPRHAPPPRRRFGVPDRRSLGDLTPSGLRALDAHADALRGAGHTSTEVDLTPFMAAGDLLYGGAWLAERTAAVGPLLDAAGADALEVVRRVVDAGRRYSGVDVFRAMARLDDLRAEVAPVWSTIEALVVPSVPTVPTVAAVEADPIGANLRIGRYSSFGNLVGLAAITVPCGYRDDGTPSSATILGPRGREGAIARLALDLEAAVGRGRPAPGAA